MSGASSSSTRKWNFELKGSSSSGSRVRVSAPPGMVRSSAGGKQAVVVAGDSITQEKRVAARQKEAQGFAMSPAKNIFTTGLMLWMSGSSIQIFSIYATGNALVTPLTAMAKAPGQFKRFEMEGVDLTIPMLIYYAMQLVLLGIALWKLNTMGLLPMTSADWTSSIPIRDVLESSGLLLQ